jgi:hypothetical protein
MNYQQSAKNYELKLSTSLFIASKFALGMFGDVVPEVEKI